MIAKTQHVVLAFQGGRLVPTHLLASAGKGVITVPLKGLKKAVRKGKR